MADNASHEQDPVTLNNEDIATRQTSPPEPVSTSDVEAEHAKSPHCPPVTRRPQTIGDSASTALDAPYFPPYQDKGDNAPVWRKYVEETNEYDKELIKGWNEGIDVFLVFTGLFSAILSAFLIYSWTLLQPDNGQATVNGIAILSQQLVNMSLGHALDASLAYQPQSFAPSLSALAVNGLWFTALLVSLFAAVTGMLVKEWLNAYTKDSEVVPLKRVHQRELRYTGLQQWSLPAIVTFLPLAIHFALFLFFIGLVILAWPISLGLAGWMASLLIIGFCVYCASALAPLAYEACPYKSPLYTVLFGVRLRLHFISRYIQIARVYFEYTTYRARKVFLRIHSTQNRTDVGVREPANVDLEQGVAPVPEKSASEAPVPSEPSELEGRQSPITERVRTFQDFMSERDKQQVIMREQKQSRSRFAHQVQAVLWLVRSPDQSAQNAALLFLSWWRMPVSWWTCISPEVQSVAIRFSQEGPEECLEEKADHTSRVKLAWPLLPQEYTYSPSSLASLLGETGDDGLIPQFTSMLDLCQVLEKMFPNSTGDSFDISAACQTLDALKIFLTKRSKYNRFITQYLALLELTMSAQLIHYADDVDVRSREDWVCRYLDAPSPSCDINQGLQNAIEQLLPNKPLVPAWNDDRDCATRIRCALMECLSQRIDKTTQQFTCYQVLHRAIEWSKALRSSTDGISSMDDNAIKQFLVALLKLTNPISVLTFEYDSFKYCFEEVANSQDWLLEALDVWISDVKCETWSAADAIVTWNTALFDWMLSRPDNHRFSGPIGEISLSTSRE